MQLAGAASSEIRNVLRQAAAPAAVLGRSRHALYLATPTPPGVIAVLAHDAVRLPCALVLPSTSAELPLSAIATGGDHCLVGDGLVRWVGPDERVTVTAAREWAPRQVGSGLVVGTELARARAFLPPLSGDDIDAVLVAQLTAVEHSAALAGLLLGRGSGLTPTGDDLLAGFLVGARAFGQPALDLAAAVSRMAPARTTALSAALLWLAARGQCISEVAALADALAGRGEVEDALFRLLAVGHTSGAALACGLLAAAERAHASKAAA